MNIEELKRLVQEQFAGRRAKPGPAIVAGYAATVQARLVAAFDPDVPLQAVVGRVVDRLEIADGRGPDVAIWKGRRLQAVVRRVDRNTTEVRYLVCPDCGRT